MERKNESVLLLHGLRGSRETMATLAGGLERRGYVTVNLVYASARRGIDDVVRETLAPALAHERRAGRKAHLVTHSLGGLVARRYVERMGARGIGRVVMLAPPSRGARILRDLSRVPPVWPLVRAVLGPAARELARLPSEPAPFRGCELGVIAAAGNRKRLGLRDWYFGEAHDGKLAVSETRVEGMKDYWVCERTHSDLMNAPEVTARVAAFLADGRFSTP